MPRAALAPTELAGTGGVAFSETAGDTVNGHTTPNDGHVYVFCRNASGATPYDITFLTQQTVDGLAVADKVVSMAASQSRLFGPFPREAYGADLLIDVAHLDLKLVALHIP